MLLIVCVGKQFSLTRFYKRFDFTFNTICRGSFFLGNITEFIDIPFIMGDIFHRTKHCTTYILPFSITDENTIISFIGCSSFNFNDHFIVSHINNTVS